MPILAAVIWVLAVIAIAEGSLQIAARLSPTVDDILFPKKTRKMSDDTLVKRGNPRHPEHDENGYRNTRVVTHADIVAIGDSHTYGYSVKPDEAWPRLLKELTGCEVYNMSLGGYGPLEYAYLAREAKDLKPRLMIVGIYFGNDLFDNWEFYQSDKSYPVPAALLEPANVLERERPLEDKVFQFFSMGDTKAKKAFSGFRDFIKTDSALWGFFRAIRLELKGNQIGALDLEFGKAVSSLTPKQRDYASVFEGEDWRTIFTSRYRLAAEDSTDARIVVGRWLTEWAIEDIQKTANSIGASLLFVLLPTKEAVFADRVENPESHEYFEELIANETSHRQHFAEIFSAKGIPYVDARDGLARSSLQPYFENANGHPNAAGHAAIAKAVSASVESCQPD